MTRRLLSLILVEAFLFTSLGSELALAQPASSFLRSRSTANDGGVRRDLAASLRNNRGGIALDLKTRDRIHAWWKRERPFLMSLARRSDGVARSTLRHSLEKQLTSSRQALFMLRLSGDSPLRPFLAGHLVAMNDRFIARRARPLISTFERQYPALFSQETLPLVRERLREAAGEAILQEAVPHYRHLKVFAPLEQTAAPWVDVYMLGAIAQIGEKRFGTNGAQQEHFHQIPSQERAQKTRFLMTELSADRLAFPQLIALPLPLLRFRMSILREAGIDPSVHWSLLLKSSEEVMREWRTRRGKPFNWRSYLDRARVAQSKFRSAVKGSLDVDGATRWALRDLRDSDPKGYKAFLKQMRQSLSPREQKLLLLIADKENYGNREISRRYLGSGQSILAPRYVRPLFARVRRSPQIQEILVRVIEQVSQGRKNSPVSLVFDHNYFLAGWVVHEEARSHPERLSQVIRLYAAVTAAERTGTFSDKELVDHQRALRGLLAGKTMRETAREIAMEHAGENMVSEDHLRAAKRLLQQTLGDLCRFSPVRERFLELRKELVLPWRGRKKILIRHAVRRAVFLALTDEEFGQIVEDYPYLPGVQFRRDRGDLAAADRKEIDALRALRARQDVQEPVIKRALDAVESHPLFAAKFIAAGNRWKEREETPFAVYDQDRLIVQGLLQELGTEPGGGARVRQIQSDYAALYDNIASRAALPFWWKSAPFDAEKDLAILARYAEGTSNRQLKQSGPFSIEYLQKAYPRIMSILWFHPLIAERYLDRMDAMLTRGEWTLEDLHGFIRFKKLCGIFYPPRDGNGERENGSRQVRRKLLSLEARFSNEKFSALFEDILARYGVQDNELGGDPVGTLFLRMPASARSRIFTEGRFTPVQRRTLGAVYPVGASERVSLTEAVKHSGIPNHRFGVLNSRRKLEAFLIHEAILHLKLQGAIASPVHIDRKTKTVVFSNDGGAKEVLNSDSIPNPLGTEAEVREKIARQTFTPIPGGRLRHFNAVVASVDTAADGGYFKNRTNQISAATLALGFALLFFTKEISDGFKWLRHNYPRETGLAFGAIAVLLVIWAFTHLTPLDQVLRGLLSHDIAEPRSESAVTATPPDSAGRAVITEPLLDAEKRYLLHLIILEAAQVKGASRGKIAHLFDRIGSAFPDREVHSFLMDVFIDIGRAPLRSRPSVAEAVAQRLGLAKADAEPLAKIFGYVSPNAARDGALRQAQDGSKGGEQSRTRNHLHRYQRSPLIDLPLPSARPVLPRREFLAVTSGV